MRMKLKCYNIINRLIITSAIAEISTLVLLFVWYPAVKVIYWQNKIIFEMSKLSEKQRWSNWKACLESYTTIWCVCSFFCSNRKLRVQPRDTTHGVYNAINCVRGLCCWHIILSTLWFVQIGKYLSHIIFCIHKLEL